MGAPYLDALLGVIQANGIEQEQRGAINFTDGITITPDPSNNRNNVGFDSTSVLPAGSSAGDVAAWDGSAWGTARGTINVTAPPFNAVGDGVTDDTAAIQAAIGAAEADDGQRVVIFPDGDYSTSSKLIVKHCTLRGQGGLANSNYWPRIISSNSSEPVIDAAPDGALRRVRVEGLYLQGGQDAVRVSSGITIDPNSSFDIVTNRQTRASVWLEGSVTSTRWRVFQVSPNAGLENQYGIYVASDGLANHLRILEGSRFTRNTIGGAYILNTATNSDVHGITIHADFENNEGCGLWVVRGNVVLSGSCHFENNGQDDTEQLANSEFETDISGWASGSDADLSRVSDGAGGFAIRVAKAGTAHPYATPSTPILAGRRYRIHGIARGDGTRPPQIRDSDGRTLWAGTGSASNQAFDFVDYVGTDLRLRCQTTGADGDYAEFLEVHVEPAWADIQLGDDSSTGGTTSATIIGGSFSTPSDQQVTAGQVQFGVTDPDEPAVRVACLPGTSGNCTLVETGCKHQLRGAGSDYVDAHGGVSNYVEIGAVNQPLQTVRFTSTSATIAQASSGVVSAKTIRIGNGVAATSPGSVVRKIEVFDQAGVSLGFVPVYDGIS